MGKSGAARPPSATRDAGRGSRTLVHADRLPRPVFLLAFANNRADPARFLPALDAEYGRLGEILGGAAARWELVKSAETSIGSFLDVLQRPELRGRIAMLHFAGHAGMDVLEMSSATGAVEHARADGLADFLGSQPGLGCVFLNACSTRGHVDRMLAAGVPAVIATDHEIPDAVATEFSARLYREVVAGRTLRQAFDTAAAAVRTNSGLRTLAMTRAVGGATGTPRPEGDWPWRLYVREGSRDADQWSLAVALDDPLWGVSEPAPRPLPEAPFLHLKPFTAAHAAIFFGRRRETRAILDAVTTEGARRVLLLHGVSGAGKSSLLDAGVVPRLEATRTVLYARRQADRSLLDTVRALVGLGPAAPDEGDDALVAAWRAREAAGRPLTLIIDQVEEALADPRRAGGAELARLVAALKHLFDGPAGPAVSGSIVLGFRKEWLAEVARQLADVRLAYADHFLDRLDARGIAEAVAGVARDPVLAAHYRLSIPAADAGLPEEIAGDLLTDAQSAIAPTLQVLLTKMWERAAAADGARAFTSDAYRALAKEGALLTDFVDQQLAAMDAALGAPVRAGLALDVLAFHASGAGEATRERSAEERAARWPAALLPTVDAIIADAIERRLMASGAGGAGATRLAHDTLAGYVRRLAARSVLPVQRALRVIEERAGEWEPGGARRPLDAPDVTLVDAAVPWLRTLSAVEREMLSASREAALEAQRVRRRIRAGFAAAGVVVVVAGAIAWLQGREATRQAARVRRTALAQLAARQADPLDAALALRELGTDGEPPEGGTQAALEVLRRPIPVTEWSLGSDLMVHDARFAPDGRDVLAVGSGHDVRLFATDGTRAPIVLGGFTGEVTTGAWSPDGARVAAGDTEGRIAVWMRAGGAPVATMESPGGVSMLAWSPDGQFVAAARSKTDAGIWPAAGGPVRPLLGHTQPVSALAWSPAGALVATGGMDQQVRLFDATGRLVRRLCCHKAAVTAIAFSPKGDRVATGSEDRDVIIWDVATGRRLHVLTVPDDEEVLIAADQGRFGTVTSLAWSPDGSLLAVGATDRTVRIWTTERGRLRTTRRDHAEQVATVEFGRTRDVLLSAAFDGTARLIDLYTPTAPVTFRGRTTGTRAAHLSRDGKWVVTAHNDGVVRLWRAAPAGAGRTMQLPYLAFRAVLDPAGARLGVMGAGDLRADVLDLATGGRRWVPARRATPGADYEQESNAIGVLRTAPRLRWTDGGAALLIGHRALPTELAALGDAVKPVALPEHATSDVALAPDLKRMAWIDEAGRVVVAPRATGAPRTWWREEALEPPAVLAWAAGSARLAVGGEDGRVWVLRGDSLVRELVVSAHRDRVNDLAWDPAGRAWASAGEDGTVVVGAVGDSNPHRFTGHAGPVLALGWSADGTRLATGSADSTVRIVALDGRAPEVVRLTGVVVGVGFRDQDRELVITTRDGEVRLLRLAWPALATAVAERTRACFTAADRVRVLREAPDVARRAAATACRP